MRKIAAIIIGILAYVSAVGTVYAEIPSLSIRMEQPKSPTYINNLKINVVSLDRLDRVVSVQCYKKGPSDGEFTQFGSTLVLSAGGNSADCEPSTILNTNGTFQFYAVATAGEDSATSTTVTVDYNTSGPGTPSNYSKDKIESCTYRIRFRTADDSGKTAKVHIFRSENTSFTLDSGTLVGTVIIGSNTDGEFTNTVPDCNKTYYYAIRAFDTIGNGSGVVGDSETRIISSSSTTSSSATGGTGGASGQGAVAGGVNGNILGDATAKTSGTPSPTGDVQGETAETLDTAKSVVSGIPQWMYIGGGILLIIVVVYLLSRNRTSATE